MQSKRKLYRTFSKVTTLEKATPIQSIEQIRKIAKESFGENYSKITTAPWVHSAYAAENSEREKRNLNPLAWTEFCNLLTVKKSRGNMIVAGQLMDQAFKLLVTSAKKPQAEIVEAIQKLMYKSRYNSEEDECYKLLNNVSEKLLGKKIEYATFT